MRRSVSESENSPTSICWIFFSSRDFFQPRQFLQNSNTGVFIEGLRIFCLKSWLSWSISSGSKSHFCKSVFGSRPRKYELPDFKKPFPWERSKTTFSRHFFIPHNSFITWSNSTEWRDENIFHLRKDLKKLDSLCFIDDCIVIFIGSTLSFDVPCPDDFRFWTTFKKVLKES